MRKQHTTETAINEIAGVVARLMRRGEYEALLAESSDHEAEEIGRTLLATAELTDEQVDEILATTEREQAEERDQIDG